MNGPATSYADALLALAQTPEEARDFGDLLQAFADALEGSDELRVFMQNPTLPRAAQRDVLARLAPPDAPQKTMNCVFLMVDKGRVALLPEVAAEYRKRRAALAGTLILRVRTAAPLDAAETQRLRQYFTARYGAADALVDVTVDPGLIGGLRVQVGDMLFDQSLFGRLKGLERAIREQLRNTDTALTVGAGRGQEVTP